MKLYSSNLQFGTVCEPVKASFKLTKTIYCKRPKYLKEMVNKLDRLKNENFNRVLIPDFSYEVNEDSVTYDVDFIKGYPVGTLISKYADIVYEDVVKRTSDWTFMDLHSVNFIVEYSTDNIYAIDFQSYTYIPNHEERISRWNSCKDHDARLVHNLYGI